MQLKYAYQQFGILAEVLAVGVVIHHPNGGRTQYATDRPRWHDDNSLSGHTILLLPEHGKLIDPTIEQVPEIRALRQGPIIGRIPEQSRHALHDGETSFAVQRADLFVEYQPVPRELQDRLLDGPLLVRNDDQYRRAGINLAALALQALRVPEVIGRIRQTTTFPHLLALLNTIGDAPFDVDEHTGDVLIAMPDGPVHLDQIPIRRGTNP